jgi:hypothetical protein
MARLRVLKLSILVAAILLALAAAPACAQQRLFKCKDSKGRTYYTQVPPTECLGLEIDELSKQGTVVKKREATRTPEQLAAREAEEKRKKDEELAAKEERRKNQALLNTYSSEQDIEDSRQRALQQAEQATTEIEKRIAAAQQRAKDLVAEKEFYAKKPVPKKLQDEIKNNEIDIKGQQVTLAAKKRELGEINAKYDEDKRRYVAITAAKSKSPSGPAVPVSPKK